MLQGQAGEQSGYFVSSAGDINGDHLDDILVGSPYFPSDDSGKVTVVFGSTQINAWGSGTLSLASLADGQRGFTLYGEQPWAKCGYSVGGVGDMNGDKLDDIIIGTINDGATNTLGTATVVFGSNQTGAWGSGMLSLASLADGLRGFVLQGISPTGYSVSSAGDINGDQLDDIIIGDPDGITGKTTVVFGSKNSSAWGSGILSLATLADGQRGFSLLGQVGDESGYSVSSAGDINGDGLADILVGAPYASGSEKTTVVFGSNRVLGGLAS